MRILAVIGTRPEVIKTVPLILKLRQQGFEVALCTTGQHKEVMEQALEVFGIAPDYDLKVMAENQSLSELSAKILIGLQKLIVAFKPDLMISQGDTATSFTTCLAAFYEKVKVIHIEAGLRTGDIYSPFPEEMSRRVTAMVSNINFAPTQRSRENLLREGIAENRIVVCGNTGIDALFYTLDKIANSKDLQQQMAERFSFLDAGRKTIIVTAHRRENHGTGIRNICEAIKTLAQTENVQFVFPVHHNPKSKADVLQQLGDVPNVFLVEQIDYVSFVHLLNACHFIITDSGGIQEEAPSLGKPVLVTRFSTERQEAVEAGSSILTGPVTETIVAESRQLLHDAAYYQDRCRVSNPFGDGTAVDQIIAAIKNMD